MLTQHTLTKKGMSRGGSSLLILIVLVIATLLILTFLFILNVRNGKQAIQAYTLQDFMNNSSGLNDDTEQKSSFTETINNFFDKGHNENDIDDIDDDGDIGDGDGGE
ncbi:hypothetical protein [Metabacillus sp. FJAT-53654]|uniref:Uncharacterized protein n=1 Tax=Metabacillus rhizosphaerae TaxID=3117747 RepID=A0ABZ2MRG0_9BACI